ncbi:MAG: TatD family hydrolase [Pseudomonadota bacterium]
MLVDSHVNLHSEKYADDLDEVIDRARAAGVRAMLTISDRLSSEPAVRAVSERHAFIWRTIGVHPHYATDVPDLAADRLIEAARAPDVVGIGECGLDFYYEHSPRAVQEGVFAAHIAAAQRTGLPLVIHTRDADDAMEHMLRAAYTERPFTPLLHCYTGGPALAEAVLAMGGYVAFSGIITFKNADDVRAVAAQTPLERIIVETDCPYLAPVPHRGRRNEPAYLPHVVEKLAEIKGVSVDEAARATTDAFFRLFAKADRDAAP